MIWKRMCKNTVRKFKGIINTEKFRVNINNNTGMCCHRKGN